MAQTFKGRPVLSGSLEGEALVSTYPFNTTASYLENMFAGKTDGAPCTDAANKDLFGKDLSGAILCTTQTVGSTMGGGALMGMGEIGVGLKAMLFSKHIDTVSSAGLIIDDVWNGRHVITIDLLGDEFLETVKTGDKIKISEDGTVEVG